MHTHKSQGYLFFVHPDKLVSQTHDVRLIFAIISNIIHNDIIKQQMPGRPTVNKTIMVSIFVWAYLNNVFAVRKIQEKCNTDISYLWLTEGNEYDFRTFWKFRTEFEDLIKTGIESVLFCALKLKINSIGKVQLRQCRSSDQQKIKSKHLKQAKTITEELFKQAKMIKHQRQRQRVYSWDSQIVAEAIVETVDFFSDH